MKLSVPCTALLLVIHQVAVEGFTSRPLPASQRVLRSPRWSETSVSTSSVTPSNVADSSALSAKDLKAQERKELIRKEGGPLAFNTKYGALNPFAIYYGLVSILLGLPWFVALTACQLFYFVTRNKIDKQRRIPVFINHLWGVLVMRFSRSFPTIENREILKKFYKEGRPAMFVANHNSWMDIPFLGATVGWRNYKLVSKKELEKVPILGKAIRVSDNILVDRSDRRSQLRTLKKGIDYLKVRNQRR